MSNKSPEQNTPLARFAESPAPWILAFTIAAAVGGLAISTKHRARQERLERMSQTREGIWYDKSDGPAPAGTAPTVATSDQAKANPVTDERPSNDREPVKPSAEETSANASAREHLPSDDLELNVEGKTPPRHNMPPLALFIAISLAALAAGLGLLSYLRSVSRERAPRRRGKDP